MSGWAATLGRAIAMIAAVLTVAACGLPSVTPSPSVAPSRAMTQRDLKLCLAMAQGEADHWSAWWHELGATAAERAADRMRYVGFLSDLAAHLDRDAVDDHAYFGTDWPPKAARLRSLATSLSLPATEEGYRSLVEQSEAALEALLVRVSGHDLAEACRRSG